MNLKINNSIRQKMLDLFLKKTDNVYLIYFDYASITDAANLSASILSSTNVKFYHDYTGEFRPGYQGPDKTGLGTTKILGITYSYLTELPSGPLKDEDVVEADNLNGLYYTYLIAPNVIVDFPEIAGEEGLKYRGIALVANAVENDNDLNFTESDIIFIQTFNATQNQDKGTKQVPVVVNF